MAVVIRHLITTAVPNKYVATISQNNLTHDKEIVKQTSTSSIVYMYT